MAHTDGYKTPTLAIESSTLRNVARGKKPQQEARRSLFSRMYGGGRAAIQAKVAEVIGEEDSNGDYSDIAVDADGLPLTSSDLHAAVMARRMGGDAYSTETAEDEEEQARALCLFHEATQVISSLPFQYAQSKHLYSNRTDDMGEIALREGAGPVSLEELMALRLAVTNLNAAFILSDPSRRGRILRQSTSTGIDANGEASSEQRIPPVHRKPVPDYDSVDDIAGRNEMAGLPTPELTEELSDEGESSSTSPIRRPVQLRGFYTARAMRKLEVERISSGESDEDDGGVAQIYKDMAQRRAAGADGQEPPPVGRRPKSVRRQTSILDSKDEMKSYLFKSGGSVGYERGSKSDFLSALNEDQRRCTAPASSQRHHRTFKRDEQQIPVVPPMPRSMKSLTELTDSSSRASTGAGSVTSSSPLSTISSLSTAPSSPTSLASSVYFSSDEDGVQKSRPVKAALGKRSLTDSPHPARPKRHPGRKRSCTPLHTQAATAPPHEHSPVIADEPSSGLVIHYSHLASSSDITPRPGALGFDTGL